MSGFDDAVPTLRVVKGEPTEEELAAVIVALRERAAAGALAVAAPSGRPRGWTDRSRLMRRYTRAGAGAWRATAWVDR